MVVLIATVLAVYLAASAGLKTAVEFELIKSDRDSYYMRSALLEEVKDNVQTLEAWGGEYRSGKARKFIGNVDDFTLDNYIWLTMQYSDGTFEVPSDVLTGIRRYYSSAGAVLRKMTSKKPAAKEVDQLLVDSKVFRANTLKRLDQDVQALKERLEKIDIKL